jgi:hypothetical protein
MIKRPIACITFVFMAGCMSASQPGTGTTPTSGSIQVNTATDFDLKPGQSARVSNTPLTVVFVSVSQDSRCPSDVQCVWAGDGAIKLALQSTAESSQEATLHTTLDPKFVDYSGYRIRVVALAPYPKSGAPISADKYVVTLHVGSP